MSSTSKRSPSSIATCCVRGSCAKRTISSAVTWRGLMVMSIPACSNTSTEVASWTIAIVKPRAVHLRERRGEVVLHVVAHGEDRDLGVGDPLALEEVRVEAGRVVDAGARAARSATIRARSSDASIMRTPMPCSSRSRAIAVPGAAGAVDDDVADLAGARRDQLAPRLCRLRRADHDDPVAGADHVVAAGRQHLVAADDRGDPGVRRQLRPRAAARRSRSRSPRSSTSNSTSCTWPSANRSVCRAAGTPIVREIA